MSDQTLLCTNAFLRSFGTGLMSVVPGIYLSLQVQPSYRRLRRSGLTAGAGDEA